MEIGAILTGKVKWYNVVKGFGFIESEDVSGDVFVHWTQVPIFPISGHRRLFEQQSVSFELTETAQGFRALNVSATQDSWFVLKQ